MDMAPGANKQTLNSIYFYFQPTQCSQTMSGSLSLRDPTAAFLPPSPDTMATVLIPLQVL